jgi:pantoate--beta-alanine ligase
MENLLNKASLRSWRESIPPHARVGFVPTMGALHEGHLSLVHASKKRCDLTVASIFVNPLQFGPKEDFANYPRTLERDRSLLEQAGVDVLFSPAETDLYAADASTYVVEESVSQPLCGQFRPGHFRGVATVVLKLFNLVQPHYAFFGQKDAQQCSVLERMVRDLDLPVTLILGETVREPDGLAMSSRNRYLSASDREKAALIHASLQAAARAFALGERNATELERIGRGVLERDGSFRIQYWEARHPASLHRLEKVSEAGALLAVAAYLGSTRLIDNLRLKAPA